MYLVYVLSAYFFENLSGFHQFVISPTVTYVWPHLKVPRLRWLRKQAWEETQYHVLLALTLSAKVAFAQLALLRLQRGLSCFRELSFDLPVRCGMRATTSYGTKLNPIYSN